MRPLFHQAWVASPPDVDPTKHPQVHAWLLLCRDVALSNQLRNTLPEAVQRRAWVFSSLSAQLHDLLQLLHKLLMRGLTVAVVCDTGKQRAPTLWAAYLLWQSQLSVDTVLRVLRDALPEALRPEPVYMDLIQYVSQHRRGLI